jgi:hypothetical protein
MGSGSYGIDTAAEVLKHLITICTAVIAANLALLLANAFNETGRCWAVSASIAGGLSILSSLFFLTDIAAKSLGASASPLAFRRSLFIFAWTSFYVCILCAAVHVLRIAGVV